MNISVPTPTDKNVVVHDTVWIPLKSGVQLAARIWLPADAETTPVPAILEYIPYRRRDRASIRDEKVHGYFAQHGYAGVRVDIRGSGDSEGILLGEYLAQEHQDALEIITWLSEQPWCDGNVGMIGYSWGGYNGLQIASLRPPALKAVVSVHTTDDRYADDIHMKGGCLLTDKASWGATMIARSTLPPDPAVVGDRWREMWLDRLDQSGMWVAEWHRHQRRDEFYKHGSISEDYSAIQAPVYLVSGWADGAKNTVFRMLANLKCPTRGLVGPWAHEYPFQASPGPAIGFLQECIRWWDKWLKGIETGIMDDPMLRAWIEDPVPPQPNYDERPGRWVAEPVWPPSDNQAESLFFTPAGLFSDRQGEGSFTISSPQTVGAACGIWTPHGDEPDLPTDQRLEAGGSLVFDSAPLEQDLEILGAPELVLAVSSDRPQAFAAVVLSEVLPDGAATRVSYGLLNLSHRDSHEFPESLTPGQEYIVRIKLNDAGRRFGAGNRIRVAISTSYWPLVWPSPEKVMLTVNAAKSEFILPVRKPRDSDKDLRELSAPESATASPSIVLSPIDSRWTFSRDVASGIQTFDRLSNFGTSYFPNINWKFGNQVHRVYTIHPDDPTSALFEVTFDWQFARDNLSLETKTKLSMRVSKDTLFITASLKAFEGRECVFERDWDEEIPRDHV